MKHLGHEYKVDYCDPERDWGSRKGWFIIRCPIVHENEYHQTYDAACGEAIKQIKEFVKRVPQTKEEWVEEVERCIINEWEVDPDMIWSLLKKAGKYLGGEI